MGTGSYTSFESGNRHVSSGTVLPGPIDLTRMAEAKIPELAECMTAPSREEWFGRTQHREREGRAFGFLSIEIPTPGSPPEWRRR